MTMISLSDALQKGVKRIRKPQWVFPDDYIKLNRNSFIGYLYSKSNKVINDKNPIEINLAISYPNETYTSNSDETVNKIFANPVWIEYKGEISEDEEI